MQVKRLALLLALSTLALALSSCAMIRSETEVPLGMPHPVVTIEMENGGVMKFELYPEEALNTVSNFVLLAQDGFYDGLIFHRVVPGFVIQGGDPTGTGAGGPGYRIKGEFSENGVRNNLSHERGVISMARGEDFNSAGSQFFIMHDTNTSLDGKHAAFGKMMEDEESFRTLDAIASVRPDAKEVPLLEQRIKTITVDTFGYVYHVVKIED